MIKVDIPDGDGRVPWPEEEYIPGPWGTCPVFWGAAGQAETNKTGGVGTGICCYILRPAHSLLFVFNFSASFPATASVVLGILTGIIDDFIANLLKKTALPRGSLSPASAPKCQ